VVFISWKKTNQVREGGNPFKVFLWSKSRIINEGSKELKLKGPKTISLLRGGSLAREESLWWGGVGGGVGNHGEKRKDSCSLTRGGHSDESGI